MHHRPGKADRRDIVRPIFGGLIYPGAHCTGGHLRTGVHLPQHLLARRQDFYVRASDVDHQNFTRHSFLFECWVALLLFSLLQLRGLVGFGVSFSWVGLPGEGVRRGGGVYTEIPDVEIHCIFS
jgi:hypothetical protein